MKTKKFFFLSPNKVIEDLLQEEGHLVTHDMGAKYDAIVLGGFLPICPMLYGQAPVSSFSSRALDLEKDRLEWKFLRSLDFKKPKIGINRGAHMLNVYSGGDMWQHVDNHMQIEKGHEVKLEGKDVCRVSSLHVQMMYPSPHARILVTAKNARNLEKADMTEMRTEAHDKWEDPEVVYYKHTNSLCFQPTVGLKSFPDTDGLLFACMNYTQYPS